MTKVKICGITNLEDARAAVRAGCNALGFVFYRKSPRYVPPETAAAIIGRLPRNIAKVGVFCNARERTVNRIIRRCGLTMVQLHGNESAGFCRRFAVPVIKAFRVKNKIDIAAIKRYNTFAYLFDTYHPAGAGGTGRTFDWRVVGRERFSAEVFLAGGLHAGNVKHAVAQARPDWVDASSSLEAAPGRKDRAKVEAFIAGVRSCARVH